MRGLIIYQQNFIVTDFVWVVNEIIEVYLVGIYILN